MKEGVKFMERAKLYSAVYSSRDGREEEEKEEEEEEIIQLPGPYICHNSTSTTV